MSAKTLLKHLVRIGNAGVAMIEFAIILPLLLIMLVGLVELTNFILLNQKLDKLASSMADFTTQGTTVSPATLNGFGLAVPQIMKPYTFNGTVIFSSVASVTVLTLPIPVCPVINVPCISWQYKILGSDASHIGIAHGPATLPSNYPVQPNQNVIVAEAFLQYSPILSSSGNFLPFFKPQTLYKISVFKPRQGLLTVLGGGGGPIR